MSINSYLVRCRKCGQPTTDIEELTAINPLCSECKEKPIVYSRKGDFINITFTQLQKQGFVLQTFHGVLEESDLK
jgi:hypothetical protein